LKDDKPIATVIAAIIFSFTSDRPTDRPTVALKVETVPETNGIIDFRIQHAGGDRLESGYWKLSIVPVGTAPVYRDSSTDFAVGDQIITTNLTSGTGNYTVTNSAAYNTTGTTGKLISGEKYEVMIVVFPYKALVLDTVILAR